MIKHPTVGKRLRILRGGLSQSAFADKMGVTLRSYQRFESGERLPKGDILRRIAEIGDVTVDWILIGADFGADRVTEGSVPYGLDDITSMILQMLKEMDTEARRDVLKYAEKEKLLADLKRERKEKAG